MNSKEQTLLSKFNLAIAKYQIDPIGPEKFAEIYRVRGERTTSQQKEILISFLEENPELDNNKLKTRKALWEVLTTQLNSAFGSAKSSAKWQRVWIDLKNKAKCKANDLGIQICKPIPANAKLSDWHRRILNILAKNRINQTEDQLAVETITDDVRPENPEILQYNDHDYLSSEVIQSNGPTIKIENGNDTVLLLENDITEPENNPSKAPNPRKRLASEELDDSELLTRKKLNDKLDKITEQLEKVNDIVLRLENDRINEAALRLENDKTESETPASKDPTNTTNILPSEELNDSDLSNKKILSDKLDKITDVLTENNMQMKAIACFLKEQNMHMYNISQSLEKIANKNR